MIYLPGVDAEPKAEPVKGLKALRNAPDPKLAAILQGRRVECSYCHNERYTACGCERKA